MGQDMRPALRLTDLRLTRHHPERGSDYVLDVPRFEVAPGSRCGLIGASGSGKSTFLAVLGLLGVPDEIGVFDLDPDGSGAFLDITGPMRSADMDTLSQIRARTIGFVLQDGGLLPYLSVRENAHLAARLSWGLTEAARKRVDAAGEALGIGPLLDRMPATLSGGERQRAAVLRALAPGVRFLICDEPTAALDPSTAVSVLEAILRAAEETGATVIAASHDHRLLRRFDFDVWSVAVEASPERVQARLDLATEADFAPA